MKAFLLKVDSDMYIQWTEAAKGMGISVSEWIRRQCNIPRPTQEFEDLKRRDAEDYPAKDVPRVGTVSAPERRARVARGVSAPRATGNEESESLVKHTSESNWHSCLCTSCVKKRHDLGLEIGEVPIKKRALFT